MKTALNLKMILLTFSLFFGLWASAAPQCFNVIASDSLQNLMSLSFSEPIKSICIDKVSHHGYIRTQVTLMDSPFQQGSYDNTQAQFDAALRPINDQNNEIVLSLNSGNMYGQNVDPAGIILHFTQKRIDHMNTEHWLLTIEDSNGSVTETVRVMRPGL